RESPLTLSLSRPGRGRRLPSSALPCGEAAASVPSPRRGEGARRAGEGVCGRCGKAPSPPPSPHRGEGDDCLPPHCRAGRLRPRFPRPAGERVPEGRVRGSAGDAGKPPHPLPLPTGARATTAFLRIAVRGGCGLGSLAPPGRGCPKGG